MSRTLTKIFLSLFIPPQEIPKTESLVTVVGGAIVYNAGIVPAK